MTNIDCHDILDDFNRLIRIKQLNTNRTLLDVGLFFLVVVENARSVITSSFWCHRVGIHLSLLDCTVTRLHTYPSMYQLLAQCLQLIHPRHSCSVCSYLYLIFLIIIEINNFLKSSEYRFLNVPAIIIL